MEKEIVSIVEKVSYRKLCRESLAEKASQRKENKRLK